MTKYPMTNDEINDQSDPTDQTNPTDPFKMKTNHPTLSTPSSKSWVFGYLGTFQL